MTEKATTKKGGWFSPLRAREEAIKATQDASTAFYLIAALTAVVAWVVSPSMYVDAAIYAICGYFIRTKFSRTAAVIVAILGAVALVVTLMNKLGMNVGGGHNIILAIIVMWAAARSVEATFKLHGSLRATPTSASASPQPPTS